MKKNIFLIIFIFLSFSLISVFINKNNIKIPKESIRIRVIANSNLDKDQDIKKIVSNNLMFYLNNKLNGVSNINEARERINSSLNNINSIVGNTLLNNNIKQDYSINYGYNYFPLKTFKNNTYNEGYYESLLITLGNGLGDNFWCLLFPPLCLLDNNDDVEYTSILNEFFDF